MANFKALTVPRVMSHVNPQDPNSVRDVINQLVKFSQSVGAILNGLVYTENIKRTDQDQFKVGGPGGPIAVADGGTGDSTLTAHTVLIGEGTDPIGFAGPGDAGTVFVGQGASLDPAFSSSVNFGVSGSVTGQVRLNSASTGVIIVRYFSGGANWNFNMPVAAGSSGQSLLSGGGGTAAMTWGSPSLVVGTTTITSGTSGRVLYDNAGVLGEMTNTGTGTVNVLQTAPTILTSLALGTAFTLSETGGGNARMFSQAGSTAFAIDTDLLLLRNQAGTQTFLTYNASSNTVAIGRNNSTGITTTAALTIISSLKLEDTGSNNGRISLPATGIFAFDMDRFLQRNAAGTHTYLDVNDSANTVTIGRNSSTGNTVAGTVVLSNFTTNGFLTTTGGTGTVAVDATSYLKGGILRSVFADVGNSTTTETDLDTYTVPASGTFGNLAANGDFLEAEYGGVFVSSATATRQVRIYFGGTVIFDTGALTLSLSAAWTAYVTVTRVSSSVVRYMISLTTEGAALAAYTAVGELTGLTLSNTNILKVTGQAAAVGAATNDILFKIGNVAKFTP